MKNDAIQQQEYTIFQKFIMPLLINLIAAIVYYPSLVYGFIFDDLPTITQYFHVRVFDPAGQIFSNPRWISRILNQFTYKYWKADPFAYRIVNLAIHLAIGLLIFYTMLHLLSRVRNTFLKTNAYLISLVTASFFLLYPIQTQTVTYITQMRLEGLVALLSFAIIATFVFGVTSESRSWRRGLLSLSYALTACATGTKEIIIVLPVLLVLVDYFFIAQGNWENLKQRWYLHAGYALVLYGILAYMGVVRPNYVSHLATTAIRNNRGNLLTAVHDQEITTYLYAISQFKVLLHYMTIFFLPHRVCFDYDMVLSKSLFSLDVIIPFFMLLGMLFGVVQMWRKDNTNIYVFCYTWFVISMLPRTSIFPSTELVCDYKTYLASFGIMVMLAIFAVKLINYCTELIKARQQQLGTNMIQFGLVLLLSAGMGLASQQRNLVWSSELLFWKDAVDKAGKPRAYNNYATALWDRGDKESAIKVFEQAIAKDPVYGEPHVNLATIYQSEGNIDRALEHYRRALESGEGHRELFHNLGILHLSQNNYETAAISFREAIALSPYYSRAYLGLGKAYQLLNEPDKAFVAYEKALTGDQQDHELYYFHGALAYEKGLYDKAIASLEHVNKDYMDTAFRLGCSYYNLHQFTKAANAFEVAVNKEPNNIMFAYNAGQSFLNAHRYDRALAMFELCKVEEESLPYIPLHISKCLHALGKKQDAQKLLQQTIQTTKNEHVERDGKALMKELLES